MACPAGPVQALTDPSHQFALDKVQPFVGLVDHEDVLLAPTVALSRLRVLPIEDMTLSTHVHVICLAERRSAPLIAGFLQVLEALKLNERNASGH